MLAQRTADLAIKEAREEASHLLEEARTQAETLVSQAQDAARHLRDEAEFEAHERIDRLAEQRDRLERDIQSLARSSLGGERVRLTQALQSALGFVTESLSLSPMRWHERGVRDDLRRTSAERRNVVARSANRKPPPQARNDRRRRSRDRRRMPHRRSIGPCPELPRPGATSRGGDDRRSRSRTKALWARWAEGAGRLAVASEHPSERRRPHRDPARSEAAT